MAGENAFYMRARGLLASVDQWRERAELAIYWASCAARDPGANSFNDAARELLHRVFKTKSSLTRLGEQSDLTKIKSVFRDIATFIEEAGPSKDYITIGPPIRPDDIAYAEVGGWKAGDKKGLTFVLARCKDKADEDLIDVMMHETVHFAGRIGHYDIPGKGPAYGDLAFTLTTEQAMKNASSYAWLAWLARLPQGRWLTAT